MKKKKYRSRIDWWVWYCAAFALTVTIVAGIGSAWWVTALLTGSMAAMFVVLILGCWYEIDGDTLVVYQFFMPHRMPIMKIKEVRKTTGYLATAGMSSRRVSIKFIDRSVLKSSMPVEISPASRDAFIAHLLRVNPSISVA